MTLFINKKPLEKKGLIEILELIYSAPDNSKNRKFDLEYYLKIYELNK